jgi:hypothetical protein
LKSRWGWYYRSLLKAVPNVGGFGSVPTGMDLRQEAPEMAESPHCLASMDIDGNPPESTFGLGLNPT